MSAEERPYRKQEEKLDRAVLGTALVILFLGMTLLVGMLSVVFPEWINPRAFALGVRRLTGRPAVLSPLAAVDEGQIGYLAIRPIQIRVSGLSFSLAPAGVNQVRPKVAGASKQLPTKNASGLRSTPVPLVPNGGLNASRNARLSAINLSAGAPSGNLPIGTTPTGTPAGNTPRNPPAGPTPSGGQPPRNASNGNGPGCAFPTCNTPMGSATPANPALSNPRANGHAQAGVGAGGGMGRKPS